MTSPGFSISYSFKGASHSTHFAEENPTLKDAALKIEAETGMCYESLKLLGPGIKGSLVLSEHGDQSVKDAGEHCRIRRWTGFE